MQNIVLTPQIDLSSLEHTKVEFQYLKERYHAVEDRALNSSSGVARLETVNIKVVNDEDIGLGVAADQLIPLQLETTREAASQLCGNSKVSVYIFIDTSYIFHI